MDATVFQSCGGDLGGLDYYGDYGYGGFGPIDPDVFDNAVSDFSDYLRM